MVRNRFRIYILAGALIGGAGLSRAAKIHTGDIGDFNNLNNQASVLLSDTDAALDEACSYANTGTPVVTTTQTPAIYTELAQPELVQSDCKPASVPEPSTAALAGLGVALLGLGMVPRRK